MAGGKIRIGFIKDPIENINPETDSTQELILGAQALGASVYYMNIGDIGMEDGVAHASMRPLTTQDQAKDWYELGPREDKPLSDLDFIFMRKDPPVDKQFTRCCLILHHAHLAGVRVVNDPGSILLYNEKLYAAEFKDFTPPTLITASKDKIKAFHQKHRNIILKPLDMMAGQGVFLVTEQDKNLDVIAEMLTEKEKLAIVAQPFLEKISEGDKRIVIIDGEPYKDTMVRLPQGNNIRANLAAGGAYVIKPIEDQDREMAKTIGQRLKKDGIFFAGIDVIGDQLIEINITSPTGLRHISKGTGEHLGQIIMERLFSQTG